MRAMCCGVVGVVVVVYVFSCDDDHHPRPKRTDPRWASNRAVAKTHLTRVRLSDDAAEDRPADGAEEHRAWEWPLAVWDLSPGRVGPSLAWTASFGANHGQLGSQSRCAPPEAATTRWSNPGTNEGVWSEVG